MARGFPPQPVYPFGFDSDYTLYLVYNTTESVLCADNQAWSSELSIRPVAAQDQEIWASNGFATIKGELFYYDSVGTDANGKVNMLKSCNRNLGGSQTRYNRKGEWVRSFVVAEHHNQLVDVIIRMEQFIGANSDELLGIVSGSSSSTIPTGVVGTPGTGSDGTPTLTSGGNPLPVIPPILISKTLDYRIRHLRATPPIVDDFSCPDVTFTFTSTGTDPSQGTLIKYNISIVGSYTSFLLDFGDGSSTTTDVSGTHQYALNSVVDPVVTVSNSKCQVVQTPITRSNPEEPTITNTLNTINVPIPEIIDLPTIIIPSIALPTTHVEQVPIVFPCIDLSPFPGISISIGPMNIQVPSFISISPLNVPSIISFSPISVPSHITIDPISVPSQISISPINIPPIIGFGPAPVIAPITFGPAPVINPIDVSVDINVNVNNGDPSSPGGGNPIPSCISMCGGSEMLQVNWGEPPTLNIAFASGLKQQVRKKSPTYDSKLAMELGEDYKDFFEEGNDTFQVEYSGIGIPEEIHIVPPEFPDIKITHDIPRTIGVEVPTIPDIKIALPENFPTKIDLVAKDIPQFIELRGIDIPSIIQVNSNIPSRIVIDIPPIPSSIYLDASGIPESIQVVGFPESITLVGPEDIKLTLDESLKGGIPLVYNQGPIEMKVTMDMKSLMGGGSDEDKPCFMMVPCPGR